MRFILNFIFFGLLFYLLWVYFPEAFKTLVQWASAVFNYLQHLFQNVINSVHSSGAAPAPPTVVTPPPAAP